MEWTFLLILFLPHRVPKVSDAEHIFTAPALASTEEAEQFGVDPYGTQPSGFKLKF